MVGEGTGVGVSVGEGVFEGTGEATGAPEAGFWLALVARPRGVLLPPDGGIEEVGVFVFPPPEQAARNNKIRTIAIDFFMV